MLLNDLFKQIFINLWAHKVRSVLALFGILWGTTTIVLLLSISNGFYAMQIKNLAFLNNATIFAWSGTTSKPFGGLPQGQKVHIQLVDFLQIMHHISGIKLYSPVFNKTTTLSYQDKTINGTIIGVAPGFDSIMQILLTPGSRFIDPLDVLQSRRVLFIDDAVCQVLFGDQNPLYKTVILNQVPFTVIGSASPNHASGIRFGENNIYLPYSTFLAINGQQDIHTLFLLPNNTADVPRIKRDLINLLAVYDHFDPTDEEALHMPDLAAQQLFVTWFFRAVEIFLICCGLLTLSVGGLGAANMMFLIVTERTREIGLRLALGAMTADVLLQFFCETGALVLLGGFSGFMLAIIILAILNHIGLPSWLGVPHISFFVFLMTIGALMAIGSLAGYFPARRAARMKVVEALAF